jgi:hypothetical protein
MRIPRFQFTLRQLLLAMSWTALEILAWIKKDDFKPASDQHINIALAIMMCQVVPFFTAIGVLMGQTWRWTVIGLVRFALLVLSAFIGVGLHGI